MALTFVLGRAGSGKTRYCLDAIRARLTDSRSTESLILLVPEQASFQMERALALSAPNRGYTRASVTSFSRLTQRVLDTAGGTARPIGGAARAMALRVAVTQMGNSLKFYREAARTHGFYADLDQLVAELLREDVDWDDLRQAARSFADGASKRKLAELTRIYRNYRDWLGDERIDDATQLAAVRAQLDRVPWLQEASLWVDGFAGFTGQERETLVALAKQAGRMTVTLLVDPHAPALQSDRTPLDPLDLFERAERTYRQLSAALVTAGVRVEAPVVLHPEPLPRFARAPTLAQLEAGLSRPVTAGAPATPGSTGSESQVRLREYVSHREELRAAARHIRAHVSDPASDLRFRDFALIARDLEPFAPLIADVFAEYDIPHFLDRRRPMHAHPLSRLVDALGSVVVDNFSASAVTRLLRTGLLPMSRDDAERLENTIARFGVEGDVWSAERWGFLNGEIETSDVKTIERLRRALRSAVEPLVELARKPTRGAQWARCFYDVLTNLGVAERIQAWIRESQAHGSWERAETHRLAWEALVHTLEPLHDVLGATLLGAREVTAVLADALRDHTLGLAPPTLDQVLVSAIERSRHPDIRHAWVFAFNEGTFPARPGDDALLSADERRHLSARGLTAPAPRQSEAFGERLLAYIALTRPSDSLTISYAATDEDGGPLLPSPLVDEIRRALPALRVERPDDCLAPVCVTELARLYLEERGRQPQRPAAWARYSGLCDAVRHDETARARLGWLLRGVRYDNQPASLPLNDAVWQGSPSAVETFLACPFKYLATYRLRLNPERAPTPISWDLGSAAHGLLAEVTQRGQQEPGGVRGVPDSRWEQLLSDVAAERREALAADLSERQPALVFLSELLVPFVKEVLLAQAERWRRGRFEPVCCEQRFGQAHDESWPALDLPLDGRRAAQVRGIIDRVDVCRDADRFQAIVSDYKSSLSPLHGVYLTGARLQLMCYLLAVRHAFPAEAPPEIVGAFLIPLFPDTTVLNKQLSAGLDDVELRMHLYRPHGLFLRDVAQRLDTQLGQQASPVARMRLKKDGDFDKAQSRDAITRNELDRHLDLATRTLQFAATGILDGDVTPAPLVERRCLACNTCDFQAVCRFDPQFNTARLPERSLPTLEDAEPDGTEKRP